HHRHHTTGAFAHFFLGEFLHVHAPKNIGASTMHRYVDLTQSQKHDFHRFSTLQHHFDITLQTRITRTAAILTNQGNLLQHNLNQRI
ncbi:MAG: hypothetical protein AAF529_22125, partial [Pseudomonadota bacterium]